MREVLASLKLVNQWSGKSNEDAKPLPKCVGDFEILDEIGRGGMGVVYRARQVSLNRIVALKILPLAASLDRKCLERFRIETHSASILQHPNIVAIYGTGCDQGVHYYAMQYIAGKSLQELLQAAGALDVRRAANIIASVASGLQHAHELGVVHRDIKPSNLLIDEHEKVWITDFGLAQIDDHGTLTLSGDFIGTMRYMSPEQTLGGSIPVDHRTDIYSLGATLYELIVHEPLIPGRGRIEILKNVLEVEARFPKSAPRIPRDLQTIVLKATAKERDFRYATAAAMADDLKRFLDNRPILASRPTISQRLIKVAIRNPVASASLALLPVVFLIGMLLYNLAIVAQKREIEKALLIATANENLARQEAHKARTVSDILQQLVASANPDQTKGAEYTVRQLLDDLSENIFEQLEDQPEVAIALRSTIGNAYRRLGSPDRALTHLQLVLDYHQQQRSEPALIAQDYTNLAWNYAALGKYEQAIQLARQATDIHGESYSREAVQALWCLQHSLIYQQQFEAADEIAQRAIKVASAIDPQPPELANILHDLAQSLTRQGKPKQGVDYARQAIALHQRMHGDEHPETGWGYESLGRALAATGDHDGAAQAFQKALAIFESKYPRRHKSVRMTLEQLESALRAAGTGDELAKIQRQRMHNMMEPLFVKQDASESSVLEYLLKKHNYTAAGELVMIFPEAFDTTTKALMALQVLSQYELEMLKQRGMSSDEQHAAWRAGVRQLVERAADKCPDDANVLNSIAWHAVIPVDPEARLPQLGVKLAERATELDAQKGAYWNTLGLAYLRANRLDDAVRAIKRSQSFETTDEYDTVLLSIALAQQGERDRAVEQLELSKQQYAKHAQENAEFESLLKEAAARLDR